MESSYLLYLFSMIIFGFNGILAHYIELPSSVIVFWRIILGFSFLLALLFISRHKWKYKSAPKELFYLTLSGICIGAAWLLLYAAYNLVGVSIATLLYNCGPIIVILLGIILYKEPFTFNKTIGLIAACLGIILLNLKQGAFNFQWLGLIYGLGSAFFYALMVLLNKKAKHIVGCERSFWQLLTSIIITLPIIAFDNVSLTQLPIKDLIALITLGIFNTGFACFLYFKSMEKLPMNSVAILGYLESFFAVLFAYFLLGEDLSILKILGLICIIGGAIIAEKQQFKSLNNAD